MGMNTEIAIEQWQQQHGIEPATGDKEKALRELSRLAHELIEVIALERSGIRDGDGKWHGSDPLGGLVKYISEIESCYGKEQPNDDHFGLCPECKGEPTYLNVHKQHYGICNEHKVYWPVGWNLFSSWQYESEQQWQDNSGLLDTYTKVKPYFYPRPNITEAGQLGGNVTDDSTIPF